MAGSQDGYPTRQPGWLRYKAARMAQAGSLRYNYSGGRSADIWIILAPTERAMSSTCTTTP